MNGNTNNRPVPKMMTVHKAAATGIMPAHAIWKLVKDGKISSMKSGNRTLIDYNRLIEYLQGL